MRELWTQLAATALCVLICSVVESEESVSEPIVVQVDTKDQLVPITLHPIQTKHSEILTDAVHQLDQVLCFDFSHNGTTVLTDQGEEGTYILTPTLDGNTFSLVMREKGQDSGQEIGGIALSGDPLEDRRVMHRVADRVHQALFGEEGIASTRILFTRKLLSSNRNKEISEVWEADYDGKNARQVTHEGAYAITPIYIPPPKGKRTRQFLYVSYEGGQPRIKHASLKDGSSRRLMSLRGNQLLPAVSRQRDAVAFISDVTGNPDLFYQEFTPEQGAQGKPRQVFTAKGATQGSPTFSPNGQQIAFVSDKGGPAKIYLMDLPEAGTRRRDIKTRVMHTKTRNGTAPTWSPDGKKIAFSSRVDGVRQIWIHELETGAEWQLTQGAKHKENPTWAPNSKHLIFNTVEAKSAELFMVNLTQKQAVKLTAGPGEFHYPSWEPR